MGCTTSNSMVIQEPMYQNSNLTPEEIQIVKESWSIVSHDLAGLGLRVFKKFFEKQQGITVLFERLMSVKLDGPVNFHDDQLKKHATIVMKSLGAAVECLEDSKNSTNFLINIGKMHAKYDVHPDMIPYFWPAIIEVLKEILQEKFTRKLEESWCNVFEYITCKFKQGIIQEQLLMPDIV